jgi:hypothetical protein
MRGHDSHKTMLSTPINAQCDVRSDDGFCERMNAILEVGRAFFSHTSDRSLCSFAFFRSIILTA